MYKQINLKSLQRFIIHFGLVLLIPSLISGPFLPDLIVTSSSLIFLYHLVKTKNFCYFNNKPLILFFIFCFYCILLSIFRAKNPFLSFESSLFYFRIGIFSCLIWFLIEQDKNILKFFYYAIVISFSILVIDGFFEYFNRYNLFGNNSYHPVRVSSFFGEDLILGSYLSRIFPLLFALFLIKKKKNYEIYFIGLLFILVDILIFVSAERTAFIFLNLSTIFIIILIKEYKKFRFLTFIIGLIFIIGLSLSDEKISYRMIKAPFQTMGLLEESKDIKIFTEGHDSVIKTAFNMFRDKPIFGHGPKMFRQLCSEEKYATGITPCMTHPHNFYIQLLAETGIIGFLFLFSAFCYVLYCGFMQLKSIIYKKKQRYLTDYQVCLLAGILITVWPFSPNGNFFNNWLMIVYILPVGFYLQSIFSTNKKL